MKLSVAVSEARGFLQDSVAPYRYSDSDLVQYANDALAIMADRRPDLFLKMETINLVAGATQTFTVANSRGITDFIGNEAGGAVRVIDSDTLDAYRPGWGNDTAGATRNVMLAKGNKFLFYVYPPAKPTGKLTVQHVYVQAYALTDDVDNRVAPFLSAVAAYIAGAAEAREAEGVGPQRHATFLQDFVMRIGK